MPVRHAVFQDNVGDALSVEPGSHVVPFVIHGQAGISAARTHEDRHPVGIRRAIDGNGGIGDVRHAASVQVFLLAGQAVCVGFSVGP